MDLTPFCPDCRQLFVPRLLDGMGSTLQNLQAQINRFLVSIEKYMMSILEQIQKDHHTLARSHYAKGTLDRLKPCLIFEYLLNVENLLADMSHIILVVYTIKQVRHFL
jgi:hypothetical protein